MKAELIQIMTRASRVGILGVSLGSVAGLSCLFVQGGAEPLAQVSGLLFWGLMPLAALVIVVTVYNDLQGPERALYRTGLRAYGHVLIAGVGGAAVAMAIYFTLAVNVPLFFGGPDLSGLGKLLADRIGLWGVLATLGVTATAGVWAVRWAQAQLAV